MKGHILSVHERKRPFQCNTCSASFSQKGGLRTHIALVHVGMKSFKCAICSKSYKTKQSLKLHIDSADEGKKHTNVIQSFCKSMV